MDLHPAALGTKWNHPLKDFGSLQVSPDCGPVTKVSAATQHTCMKVKAMPQLRHEETESEQDIGALEQVPALGKAEHQQAGNSLWLGERARRFRGELEAHVEGGDGSWSILCGRMRRPGSPSPETAWLGLGTAGPELPVPVGLSQPCSSAPSPTGPPRGGAGQPGPVPFKPLELLPAVASWGPPSFQLAVRQIKSLLLGC